MTVKAKKDDFIAGWGQCLAEMVAMQKLNKNAEKTLFGIVSNGQAWQFGKLQENRFSQNRKIYTISELESLLAAVNFIFGECAVQVEDTEWGDRHLGIQAGTIVKMCQPNIGG